MITIITIIFLFYLVAELVKQGAANKARKREAARQREVDRLKALRDADQKERERLREEVLRHDLEIVQLQREQIQAAKEQARLAKEQEKLAAEQRKQAEQIAKLTHRIEQAEEDILQWENQIDQLQEYYDYLERERDACVRGSASWHKWNNKCINNLENKFR